MIVTVSCICVTQALSLLELFLFLLSPVRVHKLCNFRMIFGVIETRVVSLLVY